MEEVDEAFPIFWVSFFFSSLVNLVVVGDTSTGVCPIPCFDVHGPRNSSVARSTRWTAQHKLGVTSSGNTRHEALKLCIVSRVSSFFSHETIDFWLLQNL